MSELSDEIAAIIEREVQRRVIKFIDAGTNAIAIRPEIKKEEQIVGVSTWPIDNGPDIIPPIPTGKRQKSAKWYAAMAQQKGKKKGGRPKKMEYEIKNNPEPEQHSTAGYFGICKAEDCEQNATASGYCNVACKIIDNPSNPRIPTPWLKKPKGEKLSTKTPDKTIFNSKAIVPKHSLSPGIDMVEHTDFKAKSDESRASILKKYNERKS